MDSGFLKFACDAMLGSLARWLRAAGYDSFWQEGIDDWDLIRLARREQRILISCDTGIFRIGIVRDGDVPALQLPNSLTTEEQLARVMNHFQLSLTEPLCMTCGGTLVKVSKESVVNEVPARTYQWVNEFRKCQNCGKPFWKGTHWEKIEEVLQRINS